MERAQSSKSFAGLLYSPFNVKKSIVSTPRPAAHSFIRHSSAKFSFQRYTPLKLVKTAAAGAAISDAESDCSISDDSKRVFLCDSPCNSLLVSFFCVPKPKLLG